MKNKCMLLYCTVLCVVMTACHFSDPLVEKKSISSLSFKKTSLTISVGASDYVSVVVKPVDLQREANISWTVVNPEIIDIIPDNYNVVINGNGKISKIDNSMSDSLILNYGNIEINNATIYSSSAGDLMATISVLDGTVTSNNATINGITAYAGPVTINGGTYEYISTSPVGSGNYIINSGTIGELGMRCGGHVNINGGTVTKIHLADDSSGIYLTIGSLDLAVSSTNPCIEEIMFRTDLAGCIGMVEINFYNGIVKTVSGSVELFEETGFYTAIRPGYTSQVTTNGTILVPST